MEHLSVKKQLIQEEVSFGDDSEFCIHSKIVNQLQGINSSEDSEYDQESSSSSDMDVDQDTQQIVSISSKKRKRFTFIELFNKSSNYTKSFQMYKLRKISWSESKINYIFKHYQLCNDFAKDNRGLSPKDLQEKWRKGTLSL